MKKKSRKCVIKDRLLFFSCFFSSKMLSKFWNHHCLFFHVFLFHCLNFKHFILKIFPEAERTINHSVWTATITTLSEVLRLCFKFPKTHPYPFRAHQEMSSSSHCVSACVHIWIFPHRYVREWVCAPKGRDSQNTNLLRATQWWRETMHRWSHFS